MVSALAICPLSAREAEATDTPARAATCVIVARGMDSPLSAVNVPTVAVNVLMNDLASQELPRVFP
ncbi:hypothetical protein GCM10010455_21530 [Microbacterium esteraromaticum]